MFDFHVIANDEDFIAFNLYVSLVAPWTKKQRTFIRLFFPLISVIMYFLVFLLSEDPVIRITVAVVLALYAAWGFFFYPLTVKRSLKRRIKAMKKNGQLPYDAITDFHFGEEEIAVDVPGKSRGTITYQALFKVVDYQNGVYLFLDQTRGVLMPPSTFRDRAERENFVAFVTSKMK